MEMIYDQTLLSRQYRDSSNLEARVEVHKRFSANPNPWYPWVFDRLALKGNERILELGCGAGGLWLANLGNLPSSLQIALSDFSAGMAAHSQAALQKASRFSFLQQDAQAIAFNENTFERVVANHMLYHVPNIPQALQEIRRVLTPDGFLMAATNGIIHMQDLYDLIIQVYSNFSHKLYTSERFGLESGAELVRNVFSRVEIEEFPDSLWVTESLPLVRYACSLWDAPPDPQFAVKIGALFDETIRQKGGIFIRKSSGVIRAWK